MQPFGSDKSPSDVYNRALNSAQTQDQSPRKIATSQADTQLMPKGKQVVTVQTVHQQVRKLAEYQKIVERDERLGVPEAQAALEVVHHFNEDMTKIQANMDELMSLMQQMSGQAELQQK